MVGYPVEGLRGNEIKVASEPNLTQDFAVPGDLHMAVLSLVVALAMVATTIGVVRHRHRQRLSALGLDWLSKMDADLCVGGSQATSGDFVPPAKPRSYYMCTWKYVV